MISAYLCAYRNGVQSPITPLLPPASPQLEISVYKIGGLKAGCINFHFNNGVPKLLPDINSLRLLQEKK